MLEIEQNISIQDVVDVCRNKKKVELSKSSKEKIIEARKNLEKLKEKETIYGVNTGFGSLCNKRINDYDINKLQENLIMSHSCGFGDFFDEEIVKGMILLMIYSSSQGYSGLRLKTIETLLEMLNKGVIPLVPEKGSLGASGDLVPHAHLALALIGKGKAIYKGKELDGKSALSKAGIAPIKLEAMEGLSIINGTYAMTSIAALAIHDALILTKTSDIVAAMSLEALKGRLDAFDERIHNLKPHKGQIATAKNINKILESSNIIGKTSEKVQDAYSLRCIPQVHGASKDAINYIKKVVDTEINSITDNPLIFKDEVISGGNFHGQAIAIAMDMLKIALAELGNISERRINRLVDSNLSGLPPFLIEKNGINSGLMIPHYVAASLVSENKNLCYPASVDSIPVSANQEDHVSMGSIAARRAREVFDNTANVLAIELLSATQALEFHSSEPSKATKEVYNQIRKEIPVIKEDRVLYNDIKKIYEMIRSGKILKKVEKITGKLE